MRSAPQVKPIGLMIRGGVALVVRVSGSIPGTEVSPVPSAVAQSKGRSLVSGDGSWHRFMGYGRLHFSLPPLVYAGVSSDPRPSSPGGGRPEQGRWTMFNRVLTFQGATDVDGGVTYLRQSALPVLEAQHGYRGVTASGDLARGIFGILSVWDTESDRSASDGALGKAREEALKIVGGELTVENFEEVAIEMVRPPSPGCGLFVTRVHMDPSVLEENLEFFKSEVLPQIKSQSGFCSLRNMIDRATGRGIVGSVWETRAQAETMQATAPERRGRAEERGVSFDDTEVRDILFASVR